jgi:hypothetical protein
LLIYRFGNHDDQAIQVITMEKPVHGNSGIKLMVKKYRKAFRVPENLDFYSEEDFILAERKFLKYALLQGKSATTSRPQYPFQQKHL